MWQTKKELSSKDALLDETNDKFVGAKRELLSTNEKVRAGLSKRLWH
jgi:hypothetical protein